jgi:O-antigen/teichoic acid export membrane protein
VRLFAIVASINFIISFCSCCKLIALPTFTKIDVNHIVNITMPLWVISVMNALNQQGGCLVAGKYLDIESLAILGSAQRLVGIISFVILSVNFVVVPRFSGLYASNKYNELKQLYRKSLIVSCIISIPIGIVFLCFPIQLMVYMFGESFAKGGAILVILAIGQLINSITGPVGYLLTMSGYGKSMRNVTVYVGGLSLILSLFLTKYYGIIGSAIAISCAVSLQNILALMIVKNKIGLSFFGTRY